MAEAAWYISAAACVLAIATSLLAWLQYRRARRWQIRAEEAEAWADEYQRERDMLARQAVDLIGENRQLREAQGALRDLVALRTRQLLATNYAMIEFHRRRD